MLPCIPFKVRGASDWLSNFSKSEAGFLDLLFIRKNATIAPTTKTDIIIPAMPPPPIPDFLLSALVLPASVGVLLSLPLDL